MRKWSIRVVLAVLLLALPLIAGRYAYCTGFEQGYVGGHHAGFEKGYIGGYQAGYPHGYTEGEQVGYAEGKQVGYAMGYATGKQVGYADGYTTGEQVGYEDGYWDGYKEAVEDAHGFMMAPFDPVDAEYLVEVLDELYLAGLCDFGPYIKDVNDCSDMTIAMAELLQRHGISSVFVLLQGRGEGHAVLGVWVTESLEDGFEWLHLVVLDPQAYCWLYSFQSWEVARYETIMVVATTYPME